MKTTVEIPDDLMKAIKLRAVDEGKKLNEIMRDLLMIGLTGASIKAEKLRIVIDVIGKRRRDHRNGVTGRPVAWPEWPELPDLLDATGAKPAHRASWRA